ncbi:MAG TPA: hypothetical protein VEJ46_18400 [Candidatus Acidoferrum sp.]|nr:hypothetical protein [Candidatus Acidoferrum sp.]
MQLAQLDVSPGRTLGTAERTEGRLAFRIAETLFTLSGDRDVRLVLDPGLRPFAVEPEPGGLEIRVGWTEDLMVPSRAPIFHSGGLWSLYQESDGFRFYFSTPRLGRTPYKAAWFDSEFTRGDVVLLRRHFDVNYPVYPLEYPLDELAMIHRLACGEGVEVHAVGLVDEWGRGHVFLGHSGAGKSTTARLWQAESKAHILSDDRIILRVRDDRIWMHGTPWHGDAGIASPDCAPLSRLYLLEHARKTELSPVSRGRATAELLSRSFVPHHSPQGLQFTLRFLERVAEQIPCFIFRFTPDKSAVEAICRAPA